MKKILIIFICLVIFGCIAVILLFQASTPAAPNTAEINDAAISAFESANRDEALGILTDSLRREIERTQADIREREIRTQIVLIVILLSIGAVGAFLALYCHYRILKPFREMREFAQSIAAGNLDIPLKMDRHGSFGAFTESFDLMREELKRARENERAADRSKKELVASLSHDIKTPVASIKAATELMLITAKNEKEKAQLEQINAKAEQINTLITNMFHATLEELQELSVTVTEMPSTVIVNLIKSADYKSAVKPFEIPECIVTADPVRLEQVFDNIIGNSYKYADTDIEINSYFDDNCLVIEVMDYGSGVPDDDLPLIAGKFYRGKNAQEKSGYGLGLYICANLLTQMSGNLSFENRPDGFIVRIRLSLA